MYIYIYIHVFDDTLSGTIDSYWTDFLENEFIYDHVHCICTMNLLHGLE